MPEFVKKDHDYSAVESYLQNNDVNITNDLTVGGNIAGKVPLRDYIINGSFKYWLDNTGVSLAPTAGNVSAYSTLMKFDVANYTGVGASIVGSRMAHAIGQTDVPTNSPYYNRTVTTTSNTATEYILNRLYLEDLNFFSSKTVTLSVWMKSPTSGTYVGIEFEQLGTSSNTQGVGAQKVLISTSWKRYDFIVALPSVAGKTFTSGLRGYYSINLWYSADSQFSARNGGLGFQACTVDIAKVQLIDGDKYVYIPERSETEELNLIHRYYYNFSELPYSSRISFNGTAYLSTQLYAPVRLPVVMRVAPTISFLGNWRSLPGGASLTMSYTEQTTKSFFLIGTTSGWTSGQSCIIQTSDGSGNGMVADARF